MFRTRIRKIIRDVRARPVRTALVSLAIFIGVAGTIALFSMSDIIVSQLREDIQEDELAMLEVNVRANVGDEPNDEIILQQLSEIAGVSEIQGVSESFIPFKINIDDEDFENGVIRAYTAPYESLTLEPMRLVAGEYPSPDSTDIVIEQRMADEYDLEVGDVIYYRVLSPSTNPETEGEIGTLEPRTIAAIAFHPYNNFAPAQSAYTASLEDARYISGTVGLTIIQARFVDFASAEADSDDFTDFVANDTIYIPGFTLLEDPAQNAQIQTAELIGQTMGFLALLALIVSGFLVINVISSLVLEQKRQIGLMKSIGATRSDNFFMYSGIAFAYGVIAVIPGVIIGIPAGFAAADALGPQLNTVIGDFRISPGSVILGVVVGLAVPVAASIIPVFLGTRVQILDAMTDLGIDASYGSGPIARMISILPIPITIRQGLSNVSIKKYRLLFTVLTLAIAVGAFMGIFSVFDSITDGLGQFIDSFNVEVGVFPNQGRDPEEVTAILSENFQVSDEAVEAELTTYLDTQFDDTAILAPALLELRDGSNIDEEDIQEILADNSVESSDEIVTDIRNIIRKGDYVRSIEPGFQLQVEFEGYDPPPSTGGPPGIFAYGYDIESEDPAFSFDVAEEDRLTPENAENGIIFSGQLARNMNVDKGDTVVMRLPGNSAELTIVGISEFPLDQVWIDWRTLAQIAGYTVGAPTPNEYNTIVTIEEAEIAALGADEQLGGFITFTDGEFFSEENPGIVVSSALAEANGYAVSDTVTVNTENASGDYAITGIFDLPPFLAEETPSELIAMEWRELASLEGISLEGSPRPDAYFVITTLDNKDELEPSDLDDISETINDVMLDNGIQVTVFNFIGLVEQISDGFFIFQAVLQAVAGLIALVGALGLLTTLSMSVFERQKEIGVMRSIGAGSTTIAAQFLTEGLLVGFVAWLVGLPLAVIIQLLLLDVTGFNETFPFTFPVAAAVLGLVGMIIITTLASLWPSLSAARRTVSDILRYQ